MDVHELDDLFSGAGFNPRGKTMRTIQYINNIKTQYTLSNQIEMSNDDNKENMGHNIDVVSTEINFSDNDGFKDFYHSFSLTFVSKMKEKQYHYYVTERYSTSIIISLLWIIFAYIFIAITDQTFTTDVTQVVFLCIGLTIMFIIFCMASLYSTDSLSNTGSYIMSIFKQQKSVHTSVSNNNSNNTNNIQNDLQDKMEGKSKFGIFLYDLFGAYSHYMTCICAMCLLLLLILQNTVSQTLLNDKFIIYYSLSLLIISSYCQIGFILFTLMAWFCFIIWNILYLSLALTRMNNTNITYWVINTSLIIFQLILAREVKFKEKYRRESFLRAMMYIQQKKKLNIPKTFKSTKSNNAKTPISLSLKLQDILSNVFKEETLSQPIYNLNGSLPNIMNIKAAHSEGFINKPRRSKLFVNLIKDQLESNNLLNVQNLGIVSAFGENNVHLYHDHNDTNDDREIRTIKYMRSISHRSPIFESKLEDIPSNGELNDDISNHDSNNKKGIKLYGCIDELDSWYENEGYILKGYRIDHNFKLCLKSIFRLHNETTNIWTEFIPAIILLLLVVTVRISVDNGFSRLILGVCLPFVLLRPFASGFAHTFHCISKWHSRFWWKIDFFSIILASGFGSIIWIHCVFYCNSNIQVLCIFAVLALGFSTSVTSLTTKNDVIRNISLGSFFIFTLIFLYFYQVFLYFVDTQYNTNTAFIIYWTCAVGSTFIALIFRLTQFPEAFIVKNKIKNIINETNNKETKKTKKQTKSTKKSSTNNINKILHDLKSFSKKQIEFIDTMDTIENNIDIKHVNRLSNEYKKLSNNQLKSKRIELENEIIKMENEITKMEDNIINEIKNEITINDYVTKACNIILNNNKNEYYFYIFTSHNFWHIFMNLAVILSYFAWNSFFDSRQTNQC